MVQIRLARFGSKKSPFYRIVVTDRRNQRDGRFIEKIGTYNPTSEPVRFAVDEERFAYWKSQGAQASATLDRLIKKHNKAAAASA